MGRADRLKKFIKREPREVQPPQYVETIPAVVDPDEVVRDGDSVPPVIIRLAGWAWRFLVICAALYIIFHVVSVFNMIVIALLVAFLLTALIEPLARFLKRTLKFPSALASATTLLAFLAFVGALIGVSGASIVSDFSDLRDKLVVGIEQIQDWLANGPLELAQEDLNKYFGEIQAKMSENASLIAGGVLDITTSIISVGTGLILALFCMFFFLKDGRKIWHYFVLLLPDRQRYVVNEGGIRAWKTLGTYTRTQVKVAFIDAVGIAAVAYFLGVSLWLPIGVLVFVGAFIPIVGAFVTGGIACIVALVEIGPWEALIMLIGVVVVQQIEGNVLQPFIQGTQLSLHPVVVVLAVAAGAGLAGIFGALFSVPLVAILNVVINFVNGRDMYPELKYDQDRTGGPPGHLENVFAKKNAQLAEREREAAAKVGIDLNDKTEAIVAAQREESIEIKVNDSSPLDEPPSAIDRTLDEEPT